MKPCTIKLCTQSTKTYSAMRKKQITGFGYMCYILAAKKKLVLSPDTDVYHIGLPLIAQTNLDEIVHICQFSSTELRLLNLWNLIDAFINDPDLETIPHAQIPLTMEVVYVSTGCDFISFFHGLGKASFLNSLFEYSAFVCSNSEKAPGMLANVPSNPAFLSFLRLVSCCYFRKHKAVFLPAYPTPMTLFNSLAEPQLSPEAHHSAWLGVMREKIWSRIKYEEEMIPSYTSLERHWQRSCWVLSVWKQANANNIVYPPLDSSGWKVSKTNKLQIHWDSDQNVSKVQARVALIKKGCGCKTGCMTTRCKCKKAAHPCGPGCSCLICPRRQQQ